MLDFYLPGLYFKKSLVVDYLEVSAKKIAMLKYLVFFWPLFFLSDANAQISTKGKSFDRNFHIQKELIITDQSENRILIADVETGKISWDWRASQSNIRPQDVKWFNAPSDAKAVYDNKYILMNASGGGVALVRIADKKVVFYAYAGGNTHSAELLPDGNIVTASSTGSYLMIFHTDTLHFPDNVYSKKIPLPFAHNVVWDKKRNLLWSAGKNKLYSFRYNFKCEQPDLTAVDSTLLPDTDAHDLFPMYDKDSLWLTTVNGVFKIDPATKKVIAVTGNFTKNIKDVSSGPQGFPTIIMLPKEKWWTDEVLDNKGASIFKKEGLKIYKARWLLPNRFSYGKKDVIKICQ